MKLLSRREFIDIGCKLGAGAMVSSVTGCFSGQFKDIPNKKFLDMKISSENKASVMGMFQNNNLAEICESVIPEITDLSWLSPGDSVFIKVACNSKNAHPAVTKPEAVSAVVSFLKNHGAGEIYVGDQSGVESVRLTKDSRKSSTTELMQHNGLKKAVEDSGAILHCFDDNGWNGYFNDQPDFKSTWENGIWIPNILNEVDHIIYLPRLGSHALAGYTCGVKIAVGWLRDDSRMELHQKGNTFFEKFAEINHYPAIRNKLRFTLTIADKALLNIGPDIGSVYKLGGNLFLGSENLADHDYLASSLLRWCDHQDLSILDMIDVYPKQVNFWNKWLVKKTWGKKSLQEYTPILPGMIGKNIEYDSALSHLCCLQNYRPDKFKIKKAGGSLSDDFIKFLNHKKNEFIFS